MSIREYNGQQVPVADGTATQGTVTQANGANSRGQHVRAYPATVSRPLTRFTKILGGFYLTMAGINIGLAIGDPQRYDGFAHAAHFDWVGQAWQSIFMSNPGLWAALLGAGEILIGVALLAGGRWSLFGYAGVIVFHLALLLFGWGIWLWAGPVLAVVLPVARAYTLALQRAEAR